MILNLKSVKRILITAVLFLALPLCVFAAAADPSRMPQNSPLVTPEQNSVPNYSGSANSSAEEAESAQPQNPDGPDGPTETENTNSLNGQTGEDQNEETSDSYSAPTSVSKSLAWLAVLVILVVLLGYAYWKNRQDTKE